MLKDYLQPELEIIKFNSTDIMIVSEGNDNNVKNPWEGQK